MPAPQLIVVSLRGSGTQLLAQATAALGYTPYGTMGGAPGASGDRPGPGEVYPLLEAAYGKERAVGLLHAGRGDLEAAFQQAVAALWRVWWIRLGQPVAAASPVASALEDRLSRVADSEFPRLLPGRGCWYVNSLDLERADGGFLRFWHATGQPPIVFHHRDVRDRIISQVLALSQPADRVGSLPDHLVYRDIVSALPTMDAKITLALTDPGFPGMEEARRCQWLPRHPAVRVICHEDLAGAAHGGSDEARRNALTGLLDATGHPEHALAALPEPPAPHSTGDGDGGGSGGDLAVGGWRTHFTPEHERLLQQRHFDLLVPAPPAAAAVHATGGSYALTPLRGQGFPAPRGGVRTLWSAPGTP
jgi:hypothetical protein